jgi:hypothetical protein
VWRNAVALYWHCIIDLHVPAASFPPSTMPPVLKPNTLYQYFKNPIQNDNSTGRWRYLCSLCDLVIEHQESQLLEHLAGIRKHKCSSVMAAIRAKFLPHLASKRGATVENAIYNLFKPAKGHTALDTTPSKKQRQEGGLSNFVVPGLTEKEKQKADLALLRYEHSSYATSQSHIGG